jgi:AcrR family transcriptional regulator
VHGFASLGLREVSREAGIAPTSFYRHFADMQELGAVLSGELVGAAISEVCEAVREGQGPLPSLLWDAMLATSVRDPELMRFFVAERAGASAQRASLQRQLMRLAEELTSRAAEKLPAAAAAAAVVVLIDACARALDEPQEQRAALRESCIWALSRLLSVPASAAEEGGKL